MNALKDLWQYTVPLSSEIMVLPRYQIPKLCYEYENFQHKEIIFLTNYQKAFSWNNKPVTFPHISSS